MFKDHSLRREDDLAATIDHLLQMGMKMAETWLMYRLDLASYFSQVLILLQLNRQSCYGNDDDFGTLKLG